MTAFEKFLQTGEIEEGAIFSQEEMMQLLPMLGIKPLIINDSSNVEISEDGDIITIIEEN